MWQIYTVFTDAAQPKPYTHQKAQRRQANAVGGEMGYGGTTMSGTEVVVEAFTELAPHYQATMDRELRQFWGLTYKEFIRRLIGAAAVKPGESVLDLATGTAMLPRVLLSRADKCSRVIGLDITPAMLRQAHEAMRGTGLAARLGLLCGSAMALPLAAGTFDVALCGLGTHHMDVPAMLSEARRVLKAGGRLVVSDVGASAFWRSIWGKALLRLLLLRYGLTQRSARARAEVEAFPNVRTASEWQRTLADNDFGGIEISETLAHRPWYPCGLTIKATAGAAG